MTTKPRRTPRPGTGRDRLPFGRVRQRSSGRWQAGYTSPLTGEVVYALDTFETKYPALLWLEAERKLVTDPYWLPPAERHAAALAAQPPRLDEYAPAWVANRTVKGHPLKPRTRHLYDGLLSGLILPELGQYRLDRITSVVVGRWFESMEVSPARRAHAYGLLKAVLKTAMDEQYITRNPCVIRGGSTAAKVRKAKPATLAELAIITESMPDRLRLAVLIAAWCGLRQGEVFELRRRDIDLEAKVIHVERAVTWLPRQPPIIGPPKSDAAVRDVAIPPHLVPVFRNHLAGHVSAFGDALLFVGRDSGVQLYPSTLYRWFYPAREAAGRPDLRWHDLRHTGATLAAVSGATLAELMHRIGHSTVGAAMIYQHAASDRDQVIAESLSRMASVTMIPISETTADA